MSEAQAIQQMIQAETARQEQYKAKEREHIEATPVLLQKSNQVAATKAAYEKAAGEMDTLRQSDLVCQACSIQREGARTTAEKLAALLEPVQ